MSSSSESVDSDSSSSSTSIPNISKLQPYDLEPTIPSSEVSSSSNSDEGTSDSEQEKERIGNTDTGVSVVGNVAQWSRIPKVYVVVKQMKFQMNILKVKLIKFL